MFKKGIKKSLNNLYQSNYDLEMKNKFIQVFESLEKLESFSEDNNANDNKYEELENLKQKNHELNQQLNTVTQEKETLIDWLEESLLIKNSDYYQKLKYISEPIIISKHKNNNWNIETLPNIKDKKIESESE